MAGRIGRWLVRAQDPELIRRVALLERAPVFGGLSRRLLGRLAAALFEKAYAADDIVFREGDPGKGLFIVLDGSVAITRMTPSGEQRLATLESGDSFGELALIDDLPRSASARVVAPSRLLILYRSHFESLVEGDRAVALVVMKNLLRMLAAYVRRGTHVLPGQSVEVAGTVPGNGPGGSGEPAR